ncbi:hypothetical protein KR032_000226 [Drosophila birchii]|nr:hypothetical protein KR032_000226 [Drosophila birchii]
MENRTCTAVGLPDLLPQREFHCQWCIKKVYKSRARYKGHLRSVHHITTEPDNDLFNCYHCPCSDCRYHKHAPGAIAFRQIAQLRRHYQRHHMGKDLTCAVCQREFELERELFLHKCHRTNSVTVEDTASPGHVLDQRVTNTHAGMKNSSKSSLRLFRNKPKDVIQQHANQDDDKENKSGRNGRQMQQCIQCRKKYIVRHQCYEHPCQKCGRVFYSKSPLEHHVKKCTHRLQVEDKIFVDEVLQLLSRIEHGTLWDPPLLKAFAEILPVLEKIQGQCP